MNLELPSCSCLVLKRKGPARRRRGVSVSVSRHDARVKSNRSTESTGSHIHTNTNTHTWMMHFFHSACKYWRASGGASAPPEGRAGEGMVFPIAAVCVCVCFFLSSQPGPDRNRSLLPFLFRAEPRAGLALLLRPS